MILNQLKILEPSEVEPMSNSVLEELYDRLISRAKRLGLFGLIEKLQGRMRSGKFDYDKFIEDCRTLGINPLPDCLISIQL
ncbi:MAG: hypothetical protein RMK35_05105, partial [Aquificaceae bacterium]|nr:hypothetical protein [Aquificaceae bacterium]